MYDDLCAMFPYYCEKCLLDAYGKCPGFVRINNMLVKCSFSYPESSEPKYAIYTPDGRCWEDGLMFYDAIEYCLNTKDFVEE